jgi:hypothetical protein
MLNKIIEMKVEEKRIPMRSDVAFEGLFRLYLDEGGICVEEIDFNHVFTQTFYYESGWISDSVDEARSYYFNDSLEFIDLMLDYNPKFNPRTIMDDNGDVLLSVVGFFEEKTETEGDWETGYYETVVFTPKIAGYVVVSEKDKEEIYEEINND